MYKGSIFFNFLWAVKSNILIRSRTTSVVKHFCILFAGFRGSGRNICSYLKHLVVLAGHSRLSPKATANWRHQETNVIIMFFLHPWFLAAPRSPWVRWFVTSTVHPSTPHIRPWETDSRRSWGSKKPCMQNNIMISCVSLHHLCAVASGDTRLCAARSTTCCK